MAKFTHINAGDTSQTLYIFIPDSSATDGSGLTGLDETSSGLVASYVLPRALRVSITLAEMTAEDAVWVSGAFGEVDGTNMPGIYRLDIPNAAIASGDFSVIHLKGATNMAPVTLELELVAALTTTNIVDAIWDAQEREHNQFGTFGRRLGEGAVNMQEIRNDGLPPVRLLSIVLYQNVDKKTIQLPEIVDQNGKGIDLDGASCILNVFSLTGTTATLTLTANVTGTSNNSLEFAYTEADIVTAGSYRFNVWNETNGAIYFEGPFEVRQTVKDAVI